MTTSLFTLFTLLSHSCIPELCELLPVTIYKISNLALFNQSSSMYFLCAWFSPTYHATISLIIDMIKEKQNYSLFFPLKTVLEYGLRSAMLDILPPPCQIAVGGKSFCSRTILRFDTRILCINTGRMIFRALEF